MKNIEGLQQEFQSKYKAWVATRPLVEGVNIEGLTKAKLEVINHIWLEYVLARNTLLKELAA